MNQPGTKKTLSDLFAEEKKDLKIHIDESFFDSSERLEKFDAEKNSKALKELFSEKDRNITPANTDFNSQLAEFFNSEPI